MAAGVSSWDGQTVTRGIGDVRRRAGEGGGFTGVWALAVNQQLGAMDGLKQGISECAFLCVIPALAKLMECCDNGKGQADNEPCQGGELMGTDGGCAE